MNQTAILLIGMLGGVCFAALATYLNLKRGDTLAAVGNAQAPEQMNALLIKVGQQFQIATSAPIVGLYILAAIVALGPFVSQEYQAYKLSIISAQTAQSAAKPPVVKLMGAFDGYNPSKPICLQPPDLVEPSGAFTLPMWYSQDDLNPRFTSTNQYYAPITIAATIDPQQRKLEVDLTGPSHLVVLFNGTVPTTQVLTLDKNIALVPWTLATPKAKPVAPTVPRVVPSRLEPHSTPPLLVKKEKPT